MKLGFNNILSRLGIHRHPKGEGQEGAGQAEGHKGRWNVSRLMGPVEVRVPRSVSAEGKALGERSTRKVMPETNQIREIGFARDLAAACDKYASLDGKAVNGNRVEISDIKVKRNFLFAQYEFKATLKAADGSVIDMPVGFPTKKRCFRFNFQDQIKNLAGYFKNACGCKAVDIEISSMSQGIQKQMKSEARPGRCLMVKGHTPGHGSSQRSELDVVYRTDDGEATVRTSQVYDASFMGGWNMKSRVRQFSASERSRVAVQVTADQAVEDIAKQLAR